MQHEKVRLKGTGQEILNNPSTNKGTAFTNEERSELGLHGLLPYNEATMEEQLQRRYENFKQQPNELAKHVFLSLLQKRNETLFYRLALDHIEEMLPLIYTPTVGDASVQFSSLFTHQRGIYFSYPLRDKIDEILNNIHTDDIDVIVITDGERILGLGDLGAGGMAISVGKLALYTLFGGIDPTRTLPVVIDVGTNNEQLRKDPIYIGWHHARIVGEEYDSFVDAIVKGIKKRFPKVLLQWEDFGKQHAKKLLTRYRDEICSFNDDIQGTASVVLAAIYAAVKQGGTDFTKQKIAVLGGGSAGIGICEQICAGFVDAGLSEEEALKNFYVVDLQGLITSESKHMDAHQQRFAHDIHELKEWDVDDNRRITLLEVIRNVKPTILIGVSTVGSAFTEEIVREMAKHVERPVILPLSNPTHCCEAHPTDLLTWTEGKAIVATGSPFKNVEYKGCAVNVAQCNNVYIFPGLGLGVIASEAKKVTDSMFIIAAKTLAKHAPLSSDACGSLFPPFSQLGHVCKEIAFAVAESAENEGVARKSTEDKRRKAIEAVRWEPVYKTFTR